MQSVFKRWREWVGELSHGALFAEGVAFSALGIGCGALLFPSQASLIGVVLLAFSKSRTVELLLDRNRDQIWGGEVRPRTANAQLALSLMVVFAGVLVTYLVAVQIAPFEQVEDLFEHQLGEFAAASVLDLEFGSFAMLLSHNAVVLVGCFLFALVYRHAGMLLVLAWNASTWGVAFSWLALGAAGTDALAWGGYLARTLLCILPHLTLEAAAYVLVAMAGVFTSRGVAKHALDSPQLLQVATAVLQIIGLSAVLLVAAAATEAWVAPALIEAVFAGPTP